MLPQCGHGCGTDNVVAFNSMSGARKVSPHSAHLNLVVPLYIVSKFYEAKIMG